MQTPLVVSTLFKSRVLMFALALGNIALGLTAFEQGQVIEGQKHLIVQLYHDSAELAGFKIAANMAKAKKH